MRAQFFAFGLALACVAAGIPAFPTTPTLPVVKPLAMSPKLTEQKALAGKAMVIVDDDTNVYKLSFRWSYDMTEEPDTFALHIGTNSGTWPTALATGSSTNYALRITNWDESDLRHFYTITAIRGIEESNPSLECFWPPFPPDHICLSWTNTGPVMILESVSLQPPIWSVVASPGATNSWSTNILTGQRFFKIDPPGAVRIRGFNPVNAILNP